MKTHRTLHTSSSLLFILPALYAFSKNLWWYGLISLLTALVSFYYHSIKPEGPHWWWDKTTTQRQNTLLFLDTFVALVLTASAVYLFYLQDFPPLFSITLYIFTPIFIQFMVPLGKYYSYQHTIWHTGTALLATLPVIGI